MRTTELQPLVAEPSTGDRTPLTCAVCTHAWETHDPIGISGAG